MRQLIADRGRVAIVCIALIALVWFVFGQASHFPFVNYDDAAYTSENPVIVRGLNAGAFLRLRLTIRFATMASQPT